MSWWSSGKVKYSLSERSWFKSQHILNRHFLTLSFTFETIKLIKTQHYHLPLLFFTFFMRVYFVKAF